MNKKILLKAGFIDEVTAVENGKCPICHTIIDVEDFCDLLSVKEFMISGLCQKCQDEIFK